MPKRYAGHIGLDTNSMAHSGPSQACASFAPNMSVRIFGHYQQFSTFSARRALCSAPRARRTHGPMDHTIHGCYVYLSPWFTHHVGEAEQPSLGC